MNKFDSPPIVLAHQLAHVVLLPQQPKPSHARQRMELKKSRSRYALQGLPQGSAVRLAMRGRHTARVGLGQPLGDGEVVAVAQAPLAANINRVLIQGCLSGGGSIESGRSNGRGMAHSQPAAPRPGRTWSTDPGQAANGQRYSLGSAHQRSVARHARAIRQLEYHARPRAAEDMFNKFGGLPHML